MGLKKKSLIAKNRYAIGGKKMAIFDWELGQNLVPGEGQKMPGNIRLPIATHVSHQTPLHPHLLQYLREEMLDG